MNSITLLTGATGTVGAAVLDRLLNEGRRVRCLLRDTARLKAHPLLDSVAGDLADPAAVERAMAGCDVVFHAGGRPQKWTADVSIYRRTNVDGTRNLLNAAVESGVKAFVYASTQDTLDIDAATFDEASASRVARPTSYELSKREAQSLVDAAASAGLNTRTLHLVGVFGRACRRHDSANALIFGLAAGKIPALPPGGLSLVYDEDAADAFIRAETLGQAGARYLIADRNFRLSDIAARIAQLTGARTPKVMPGFLAWTMAALGDGVAAITGRPPGLSRIDLRGLSHTGQPDSSFARQALGWAPTPFDDALRKTLSVKSSG